MADRDARRELAEKMAGEVVVSDDPGGTLRKWREEFDVSQTDLADELEVASSVISDYESGRRKSPGIGVVRRVVEGLLDIDERRGGGRIRQHARILSAGFESDVVYDLREYPATVPLARFHELVEADQVVGDTATAVAGHTIINSIAAITRLSADEFYRLYGHSTNRALVFSEVTRGESPLVALRVVSPTPSAVVLHGIDRAELWEHAPALARADDVSLAVTTMPLDEMLEQLRDLG